MIPPAGYLRRVIMTFVIVGAPLMLGLLFAYDIIKINWASNMEDQISIQHQTGPRKSAPGDAIRFDGPSEPKAGIPDNPVPADDVSLARGQVLYERNCALCHGSAGLGDGPITQFWDPAARRPATFTQEPSDTMSDGTVYITISQGFGTMPPLRENLNLRERWDVVNYVKTLSQ